MIAGVRKPDVLRSLRSLRALARPGHPAGIVDAGSGAIAEAIELFRVDRKHRNALLEQRLHDGASRYLDGDRDAFRDSGECEKPTHELVQPGAGVGDCGL